MLHILKKIKINEIFSSIQGESSHAGKRTVFVRLTGCNLRCGYCDTSYAFYAGEELTIEEIVTRVVDYGVPLVEITGGEPLMQSNCADLAKALVDAGLQVMIETNGSYNVNVLPDEVIKIIDVKAPSSGEGDSFILDILNQVEAKDELKFVIGSREDYLWSKSFVEEHNPVSECIFSPSWELVSPRDLTEWVVEDRVPVRIGIQIHKVIWDKDTQGV